MLTDIETENINAGNIKTILPAYGNRAILVGATGSGKSYLGKRLIQCSEHQYVVIIDPKDEIRVAGAIYINDPAKLPKRFEHVIIYCPEPENDNLNGYNDVFKWIYSRGHTLCFIDELYACGFNNQYPDYLRALYTRGRSRGISTIGCSQRPRWIPIYCISECEVKYCFRLDMVEDRKRMAENMGEIVRAEIDDREFWFKRNNDKTGLRKLTYRE